MLDLLLENAEHLSFEDFRTVVRRWEHLADEDGALDDAEANHANRTAGLHEVNGCVDLQSFAEGGRSTRRKCWAFPSGSLKRSSAPTSLLAPSCTAPMRRRRCCRGPMGNVVSMRC